MLVWQRWNRRLCKETSVGKAFYATRVRIDLLSISIHECADRKWSTRWSSRPNSCGSRRLLRLAPVSASGRCAGLADGRDAGCTIWSWLCGAPPRSRKPKMKTGVKIRLERLEQIDGVSRKSVMDQVNERASAALADEDLTRLSDVFRRGAPIEVRSPEENAAAIRYAIECESAAMAIFGLPLSRILRDKSRKA
jgi:hypothetical protein